MLYIPSSSELSTVSLPSGVAPVRMCLKRNAEIRAVVSSKTLRFPPMSNVSLPSFQSSPQHRWYSGESSRLGRGVNGHESYVNPRLLIILNSSVFRALKIFSIPMMADRLQSTMPAGDLFSIMLRFASQGHRSQRIHQDRQDTDAV
jgi:hypothetical protein